MAKVATLRAMVGTQVGKLVPRLPHAAVGAALGAGLGLAESRTDNEPLRQKVEGLEAKPDRGLGDTLNLAQSKGRLIVGDFAKKHPGMMAGAGALTGGMTGLSQGPEFVASLKRQAAHIPPMVRDVKTILGKNKGAA
ncbi:MAG: hypothetical protein ACYDAE_21355 [Steroidobacteraceae bacterium]